MDKKITIRQRMLLIKESRLFSMVFPFLILAFLILLFGWLTNGNFFRQSVLLGILSQTVIIGTCATGVSFIYSNGNLDISIGAVLYLAATLGVKAYQINQSVFMLIVVCIAVAVGLMAFNCTMSSVFNLKTITVAIVVQSIYDSIATLLVGTLGKISIDSQHGSMLYDGPFRYTAFIGYFVFCLVIYHLTSIGRSLRFLGGNSQCAIQTGMSNRKLTYISFLVAGIGVGLAAVFSVINVNAVTIESGSGMGMNVMLATVLGGMSIFGGAKSNSYSGMLGALTISTLNRGLLMAGVPTAYIQLIRGIIFICLVYITNEKQDLLPAREQF